jgi:hypothetical protein
MAVSDGRCVMLARYSLRPVSFPYTSVPELNTAWSAMKQASGAQWDKVVSISVRVSGKESFHRD